jgi:hypothetical protein
VPFIPCHENWRLGLGSRSWADAVGADDAVEAGTEVDLDVAQVTGGRAKAVDLRSSRNTGSRPDPRPCCTAWHVDLLHAESEYGRSPGGVV